MSAILKMERMKAMVTVRFTNGDLEKKFYCSGSKLEKCNECDKNSELQLTLTDEFNRVVAIIPYKNILFIRIERGENNENGNCNV